MLYLTSDEGELSEMVRRCRVVHRLKNEAGPRVLLVDLDIPLDCEVNNVRKKLSRVILAPRHQGVSLAFMLWGPVYVHVSNPPSGPLDPKVNIPKGSLHSLAWGEVYRTRAGAEASRR